MTDLNLFQIGSGWFPESKGGAENVFFNLFTGLDRHGFAVRGVVSSDTDVAGQTGGRMLSFNAQGTCLPRRVAAIRQCAGESFTVARPDLVASHFALYSLPILDRTRDLPVITHFHGPWALESLIEGSGKLAVRTKKAIESIVYRRAARAIVLSQSFARLLHDQYGIGADSIRVVPGGVDCDRFATSVSRAEARATLGWEPERPIVLAVRRLVKRMGLDRLVDAMALLRYDATPGIADVVLHVAGTGPERAALERQAATLGLSDQVRFNGFVPDHLLPLAYRAADITLMPTAELEGFGLAAVESLAAGTPVLATPVGGLPELVSGLSENMVLDGLNAYSIAAGVAAALSDPDFLPDADACRSYARRNFDWSVVIPKIAAIYREVL